MKVWIDVDERLEFIVQRDEDGLVVGDPIDVDGRRLRRWERVIGDYEQVQNEIAEEARRDRG